MTTITITDWLLITVTLLSPVIAVQVQKFIEHTSARRLAKKRVFHTLMATRATRLAVEHVQALNMLELEFSGAGARDRVVINKWRIYADHLNNDLTKLTDAQVDNWGIMRHELFINLLEALSKATGYNFDRVQLSRGIYHPKAHGDAEERREVFEKALVEVVTGRAALAMKVVPADEQALAQQKRLQDAVLSVFEGGVIKVKAIDGANGTSHRAANDDIWSKPFNP